MDLLEHRWGLCHNGLWSMDINLDLSRDVESSSSNLRHAHESSLFVSRAYLLELCRRETVYSKVEHETEADPPGVDTTRRNSRVCEVCF